jgi:hypothetical protein
MKIALDIGDGKSCETCDFRGEDLLWLRYRVSTALVCRVFCKRVKTKKGAPQRLAECLAAEREPGAP